jgi:predicted signal transduction protein with EAL and GGDEF domain
LRVAGCSHLQGYYFSRPVTLEVANEIAERRYLADAMADETDEGGLAKLGNGIHG